MCKKISTPYSQQISDRYSENEVEGGKGWSDDGGMLLQLVHYKFL